MIDGAGPAAADTLKAVQGLAATLNTEAVRYGKPGLQAHISYLGSMTGGAAQKGGRDAIKRPAHRRQELDAAQAVATVAGTGLTLLDRWDVGPGTSNQWWVRWRKE